MQVDSVLSTSTYRYPRIIFPMSNKIKKEIAQHNSGMTIQLFLAYQIPFCLLKTANLISKPGKGCYVQFIHYWCAILTLFFSHKSLRGHAINDYWLPIVLLWMIFMIYEEEGQIIICWHTFWIKKLLYLKKVFGFFVSTENTVWFHQSVLKWKERLQSSCW